MILDADRVKDFIGGLDLAQRGVRILGIGNDEGSDPH
jgi:hypothetical protein